MSRLTQPLNDEPVVRLYTDDANIHRKPLYTCMTLAPRSFVFGHTPDKHHAYSWLVATFEHDKALAMAVRDRLNTLSAEQPALKKRKMKRQKASKRRFWI